MVKSSGSVLACCGVEIHAEGKVEERLKKRNDLGEGQRKAIGVGNVWGCRCCVGEGWAKVVVYAG